MFVATSSSRLAQASTSAMSRSVSDAMRSQESCTDDIIFEVEPCSSSPDEINEGTGDERGNTAVRTECPYD